MPQVRGWVRRRTAGPAEAPAADQVTEAPLLLPRRTTDRSRLSSVKEVRRDPVATDPVVLGKVLDGLKRLETDPPPGS
jgi:hypothetical protein